MEGGKERTEEGQMKEGGSERATDRGRERNNRGGTDEGRRIRESDRGREGKKEQRRDR